ncbi:MAG: hypothetical protein ABSA85_03460 [Terracidiphilus sp.]|jgi:hypothetical protein
MLSMRQVRIFTFVFIIVGALCCPRGRAQAALLMEEPYGLFGALNPTGHNAIYFERICAETPVKLRPCQPGEMGVVIARYQGIDGYDWVAIPLLPYLYAVENPADVPAHVDRDTVKRLRSRYRESHLESLGNNLSPGNFVHGGWTQLVGAAYERRIYAFRFQTTPEHDDALIQQMNAGPNRTHFDLLFSNCADFSRLVLNSYFPHTFRRSIFPDAGMTTPKQTTYRLVRYARKHPDTQLTVFEIPQIPGYRHSSHSAKGIDESFVTTIYAIPIAIMNPYLAGGLFVDYLVRGRHHFIPKDPQIMGPGNLSALTAPTAPNDNAASAGNPVGRSLSIGSSAGVQVPGVDPGGSAKAQPGGETSSSLREIGDPNE